MHNLKLCFELDHNWKYRAVSVNKPLQASKSIKNPHFVLYYCIEKLPLNLLPSSPWHALSFLWTHTNNPPMTPIILMENMTPVTIHVSSPVCYIIHVFPMCSVAGEIYIVLSVAFPCCSAINTTFLFKTRSASGSDGLFYNKLNFGIHAPLLFQLDVKSSGF